MNDKRYPRIGGIQPLTLIDFPGRLASVVFLKGCNLRCSYCHNPTLLETESPGDIPWNEVRSFLEQRRGFLDGVVFSGGEPTLQHSLLNAIKETRRLGFEVGIHTNGFFPATLTELLENNDVSFVAMDLKCAPRKYRRVTGAENSEPAVESARKLVESGVKCEFRTTIHPSFHDDEEIMEMAEFLLGIGARRFVLQKFIQGKTLDPTLKTSSKPMAAARTMRFLREKFQEFEIRGETLT